MDTRVAEQAKISVEGSKPKEEPWVTEKPGCSIPDLTHTLHAGEYVQDTTAEQNVKSSKIRKNTNEAKKENLVRPGSSHCEPSTACEPEPGKKAKQKTKHVHYAKNNKEQIKCMEQDASQNKKVRSKRKHSQEGLKETPKERKNKDVLTLKNEDKVDESSMLHDIFIDLTDPKDYAKDEIEDSSWHEDTQIEESTDAYDIDKLNLGPARKRKRASPFRREELEEIVRFVDANEYYEAQKGQIQTHKSNVMQHLSVHLYKKFGTKHTLRQCQKRFSDLKTRQKKMLLSIRKKLQQELVSGEQTLEQAQQHHPKNVSKSPKHGATLTEATIEDDVVTLTLHPVASLQEDTEETCQEAMGKMANIEEIVERIVSTHSANLEQKMMTEFDKITKLINHNNDQLILEMKELKNQCMILDG